ncbi:MAG: type II secretion system protein [Bacilli bacterium]|nr:type II secretion system protein [Bacilli bacterium]
MKGKKKGFTLVELLAVIVILAVILVIAVPNVLSIINKSRNDSFLSTAKMVVSAARLKASTDSTYVPANNLGAIGILMTDLDVENIQRDVDGGTYGANSYVYVVKDDTGQIHYYITLQGSKRAINLIESNALDTAVTGAATTADPIVATGTVTLGGQAYTIE